MTGAIEPTLGEAIRRLDEVSRQLLELATQMRSDRLDTAATYVRKDVWTAEHGILVNKVEDLESNNEVKDKESRDFRRQIMAVSIAAAIPALIALMLSVSAYLSAGGH